MRSSSILVAITTLALGAVNAQNCKLLPGDEAWPTDAEWSAFNASISGRLVATVPIGAPCYDGDTTQCDLVKANWTIPGLHEESSSSMMHPIYTNHSCSPFNDIQEGDKCEVGSYVPYSVDVQTKDDVKTALKFIKEHNLRLNVRNTGHDYIGRSTGKGALSLWTHHLRDITWPTDDTVTVQAGVLGQEIMAATHEKGRVIVSGSCPTVGYAGGFTAGGGHGMLAGEFGLSADQTLSFEVITTDGEELTASPTENAELYRALSGGGAGTYAIVWSMTVQTHPDLPIGFGTLTLPDDATSDDIKKAIQTHVAYSPSLTAQKIYLEVLFFPPIIQFPLIVWYNHTQAELDEAMKPYVAALNEITTVTYESTQYDSYSEMYWDQPGPQGTTVADLLWGGRILSSDLFNDDPTSGASSELDDLIEFYVDNSHAFYIDSVELPASANQDKNAVNDAWRDARGFLVPFYSILVNDTEAAFTEKRGILTNEINAPLVAITDGSYSNEADPDDPTWPNGFYGSDDQYARLLAVKDQYDPQGLLFGLHNVGWDRWAEDSEGRLCATSS